MLKSLWASEMCSRGTLPSVLPFTTQALRCKTEA